MLELRPMRESWESRTKLRELEEEKLGQLKSGKIDAIYVKESAPVNGKYGNMTTVYKFYMVEDKMHCRYSGATSPKNPEGMYMFSKSSFELRLQNSYIRRSLICKETYEKFITYRSRCQVLHDLSRGY